MSPKNKKSIFICQTTENYLKVLKYSPNLAKDEFEDFIVETLPYNIDNAGLKDKINKTFERMLYAGNPVIVSLPRSNATCRFLKIPSKEPQEIEKIANLQALHYLPYPANELITGFQVITTDKEGYAHINLTIIHKNITDRFLGVFKELKAKKVEIILSSYGLCNLYTHIYPQDPGPTMILDVDYNQVEMAITSQKKLTFSRAFKLNRNNPHWEEVFTEQVYKTREAYLKELPHGALNKIIMLGEDKIHPELIDTLSQQMDLPVEAVPIDKTIKIPANASSIMAKTETSFMSLFGLAIGKPDESLNLIPREIKEKNKKSFQSQEHIKIISFIIGIILILGVGVANNLNNKKLYLSRLKSELRRIAIEAKPLEEIERRFEILQTRSQKTPTSLLDVLYELHQIMPGQISLNNFTYEQDYQVILRGQTQELNSVFNLEELLKKSPAFKNFDTKIRYATQKKTKAGEMVDFEIVCQLEK